MSHGSDVVVAANKLRMLLYERVATAQKLSLHVERGTRVLHCSRLGYDIRARQGKLLLYIVQGMTEVVGLS